MTSSQVALQNITIVQGIFLKVQQKSVLYVSSFFSDENSHLKMKMAATLPTSPNPPTKGIPTPSRQYSHQSDIEVLGQEQLGDTWDIALQYRHMI